MAALPDVLLSMLEVLEVLEVLEAGRMLDNGLSRTALQLWCWSCRSSSEFVTPSGFAWRTRRAGSDIADHPDAGQGARFEQSPRQQHDGQATGHAVWTLDAGRKRA